MKSFIKEEAEEPRNCPFCNTPHTKQGLSTQCFQSLYIGVETKNVDQVKVKLNFGSKNGKMRK